MSQITGRAQSTSAWALVFLYFLSGVTALAYEVLWARMLSLQFGVSIFGVVVTVAAFMLGLGAGSLLGARFESIKRPLLLFAALEAGVALFALSVPWLFSGVDGFVGQLTSSGNITSWYSLQAVVVLVVLFIPAAALGFGFPVVLRALAGTDVDLGKIYGLNALGGAFGALLPLALLPLLGWTISVYLVAALGFAVAFAALFLSRYHVVQPVEADVQPESNVRQVSEALPLSLLAYAGIGAASLMLEIGWTRLFGMLLLRTEYVLGIILAVFLLGIALGSLVAKRLTHSSWLLFLPLITGVFAILTLWSVPWLASWVAEVQFESLASALILQGASIALITFPVTMAFGAWLPLLSRRFKQSSGLVGARLYGANSLGAAIGAASAGFLLIPAIGTPATICLAAGILFVCGMVWANARPAWVALVVLGLLAWPVASLPPVNRLLPVTQANTEDRYVFEDAVSITHVVERDDGQRLLLGDLQRMDASTDPTAVISQKNQARLPLLLHPAPASVLFLGLGTGISAAGSLPYEHLSRVGVELSAGAITAAEGWFDVVNENVMEQMSVFRDDVRRFLRLHDKRYDVIVGDLFHPDLVGRSALLSVQQFARVKQRLNDKGIFVQWLALNQFDRRSLDVVMRSFQRVFPNSVLFLDGFRLALVGPNEDFLGAPAVLENFAAFPDAQAAEITGGEGPWTWLGRYFGPINVGAGPVQDEWSPVIEFQLPKLRYGAGTELMELLVLLTRTRPDMSTAAEMLQVDAMDRERFERSYAAVGLATQSWIASLSGKAQEGDRLIRFAYSANPHDRWVAFDLADRMMSTLPGVLAAGYGKREALGRVLDIQPNHEAALRELLLLAQTEGQEEEVIELKQRLRTISPLSVDLR